MQLALSVIAITYKDAVGIESTIESLTPLLASDLRWELVVVDGSPEVNTPILARLKDKWPTLPLLQIEDPPRGIYSAQNRGVDVSRGEWLWFLNGGDRLKSLSTLRRVLEIAGSEPKLDLVCCGAERYREGKYLYSQSPRPRFLGNLLGTNHLCHQAILYNRRVFKTVGMFSTDLKLASDYEHLFRCFILKQNAQCIPDRLVSFDTGGASGLGYMDVFGECKQIHRRLARDLPAMVRLQNELFRKAAWARIRVIKHLAAGPAAKILRPAWLAFNRRKD